MSDLREAAERYRQRWSSYIGEDYRDSPVQFFHDVDLLAEAYVNEHPAADDTPIDEQWLSQMGFEPQRFGCWSKDIHGTLRVNYIITPDKPVVALVSPDKSMVLPISTRRAVRHLLSALGIGKETP